MEYQQKKEQILSNVEFNNLLTFNLVQNKLERNFKALVEAVMLTQTQNDNIHTKTDGLQQIIKLQKQKNQQQISSLKNAIQNINQRLSKLDGIQNAQKSPKPKTNKNLQSVKIIERNSIQSIGKLNELASSIHEITKQNETNNKTSKNKIYFQSKDKNDRILDDFTSQINDIKQKISNIPFIEQQLNQARKQITTLKAEIMNLHSKTVSKRQSINLGILKQGNNKINNPPSNSNIVSSKSNKNNQQNKQNKQNKQKKQSNKTLTPESPIQIQNNQHEDQNTKFDQKFRIQINTLNLCYDQLKSMIEDLRKRQVRNTSVVTDFQIKHKRLQEQVRNDHQSFAKQIKNIKCDLMANQNVQQSANRSRKFLKSAKKIDLDQSENKGSVQDILVNYKNHLHDKLSKIQSTLLQFINQTQFKKFKQQIRNQIEDIQKAMSSKQKQGQQENQRLNDLINARQGQLAKFNQTINLISEAVKQNGVQTERKHNIAIARVQQVKKGLQNLRQDMQFYQSLNADKQKERKQSTNLQPGQKQQQGLIKQKVIQTKALQDMKKYINNKLHDQRTYLVGLIRDLERKQNNSSGFTQEVANLWDKMNQINLFINKKADAEDTKKNLVYLQKKITMIGSHLIKAEDNTQDARIAKTNWFCLSCDKTLAGYQGKIGKHIVWDSMPLKGLSKTTAANQKKSLPSIKNK